jgi:phage terminase large subunit GpA-like protein
MNVPHTMALIEIRERMSTADWAERNVYLSPRVPTSEPGMWDRRNVSAWARPGGPLDALDDPEVETVVAACGAQVAKTMTGYVWLMKEMAIDPASALLVMNSTVDAREKADETWLPMWEDSAALKRLLPANRRRHWTKLMQRINGSPVYWIGANSPGRLGAKPIRRLMLDEVDKYPQQTKREAGAAALARQRIKAFRKKGLAKIFEASTPTDELGEIWQEYQNGDQRKLHVPCWKCETEQVMVWAAFKIDMDLAKRDPGAAVTHAHYECPHCRAPWTDEDRWSAIDAGHWVPTGTPRDPSCRSFHMPAWCSKFVTLKYLAAQWIKAQGSQSALRDFINSECGEPYVHYENRVRDSVFAELEGEYQEGQRWLDVPVYAAQYQEPESIVIGGADVQKGYLVACFRLFIRGGDSGLIWFGDCANLEALDAQAEQFGAQFVFIDSRYRTREVQAWCLTHPGYIPTMGTVRKARALFTCSALDLDEGRRGQGRTGRVIETIEHDADMLKDILAEQIQRTASARRWLVPRGYSSRADYIAQMTAERCINGRWENPQQRPNHAWDVEALALLGAVRLGYWDLKNVDQEAENAVQESAM